MTCEDRIADPAADIESKRREAVAYLRARGIYRADTGCQHRYEPRQRDPIEKPPVVTVYAAPVGIFQRTLRSA